MSTYNICFHPEISIFRMKKKNALSVAMHSTRKGVPILILLVFHPEIMLWKLIRNASTLPTTYIFRKNKIRMFGCKKLRI